MTASLAPLDARVLLGTTLRGASAQYYVQAPIGEGGQGWVFRASFDDADGFPVVIKVLRPDSATRDALDRFRREAEILKRLSQSNPSPFIVRFYDHGEANFPLALSKTEYVRLPFTAMEYVHGESLHEVISRQRGAGLPIRRTRRILKEIRAALEIVHAQGLIHRDLKPSNVLIASEAGREVAKVTDFGLVKVVDLRATATQSLAGVSLSYAPPEQYEPGNPRVGPATDVFSYGTIIYELLCGAPAYPASSANPFEALRRIATGSRTRLMQRLTTLAPELQAHPDLVNRIDVFLDTLLLPEPEGRPQAIGQVWEHIDALLREVDGASKEQSGALAPYVPPTMPGHSEQVQRPSTPPVGYTMGARAAHTPTPGISAALPAYHNVPNLPAHYVPNLPAPYIPVSPPAPSHLTPIRHHDAADLRAWGFRLVSPGTHGALVRDAVFSDDLTEVYTLGNAGLVHWARGGWSAAPLAIGLGPHELRAMARTATGALAFAGEGGLVAFMAAPGSWDVRRYPDHDVVFHAVAADPSGQVVFAAGARASRGNAVLVEVLPNGFRRTFEVPDLGAIRGLCWLDERTVLACGDGGALVRIDDAGLARIPWERSGHLRSICSSNGVGARQGAFAVGTGGHALAIGARTEIEKVGTTQDLLHVALAPDGAAWACSANARLLRRDAGGAWRRVPVELPVQCNLVRVAPREGRVMVIGEDASLVEGVLG